MANRMLLDNYIQSYGTELPKDWNYYQVGHQYESQCVLCHESHDFIELFVYNPDNPHHRKGTGTYVCTACQLAVDSSLLRINYPSFADSELPDDDSIEDAGYLGKVDIAVRNRRIKTFNEVYQFDNSIKVRYSHLRYIDDAYIKARDPNRCYFCEIEITVSNPIKIKVPVQHCDELSGGIIKCCTDCHSKLDKDLLRADLTSIYSNEKSKCANCQTYYLVSQEEAAYRLSSRTTGRVCPECAYENISRITASNNIFYLKENIVPRYAPMARFKICRCDYCMNNFTIDLTMQLERNMNLMIDTRIACHECKVLYPKYLVAGTYVYKHNKTVWAIIHSTEGEWAYTIIKLHRTDKKVMELLTTGKENNIATLPEAVSLASDACYDIVEGKQFKLWENEM